MPMLKVLKVFPDAKLPAKPKDKTDAGFDVFGYRVEKLYYHGGGNGERCLEGKDLGRKFIDEHTFELQCNERVLINTGLRVTVEAGWEIQVRSRSGRALKQGLMVLNSPGTIDENYRGDLGVIILNTSRQAQQIVLGEAIAQIVPKRQEHLEIEEVTTFDDTKRGADGFGSTDKK